MNGFQITLVSSVQKDTGNVSNFADSLYSRDENKLGIRFRGKSGSFIGTNFIEYTFANGYYQDYLSLNIRYKFK